MWCFSLLHIPAFEPAKRITATTASNASRDTMVVYVDVVASLDAVSALVDDGDRNTYLL